MGKASQIVQSDDGGIETLFESFATTVKTIKLQRHKSTRPRPLGLTVYLTHFPRSKRAKEKFLCHDEILSKKSGTLVLFERLECLNLLLFLSQVTCLYGTI